MSTSSETPAESGRTPSRIVVALGGNAITRDGDDGSVERDYFNLNRSLASIANLVERGHEVLLTHGNGPQVGNQMMRVEASRGLAPDLPLDIIVADLQGGLGYMISRVLRNHLLRRGIKQPLCTLLTLVEISRDDPAFDDPTKFVGRAYDDAEAAEIRAERDWQMKRDGRRGWRRVVPSPDPQAIVECDLIRTLVDSGALVIVTGGGGIPVARGPQKLLHGVEAVIDKDLASEVLARDIDAEYLIILTAVEKVILNFETDNELPLDRITVSEARRHFADGQFPPGSMGPKMEAACRFAERTGGKALITDVFTLDRALDGETGTWVVPDDSD